MISKKSLAKIKVDDFFNNDNTLKGLGFDYQKLIALEKCLEAKKNEYIWIECKGDVADQDASIEVKHHNSKHNLISNSEDAWKTIKNYVENFHLAKTFNRLILHTTSSVPEDSIFCGWNGLTTAEKKNKLLEHVPSESIKEHHDKINACPSIDLQTILERFLIFSDQPKIAEKWPGSRYFCESFYGHPCPTSGKSYATANACSCPSRPASFVGYPARGIQHHSRNDSTRYRKACIFTTQKALRENTCAIASGDYSTPVSQRRSLRCILTLILSLKNLAMQPLNGCMATLQKLLSTIQKSGK